MNSLKSMSGWQFYLAMVFLIFVMRQGFFFIGSSGLIDTSAPEAPAAQAAHAAPAARVAVATDQRPAPAQRSTKTSAHGGGIDMALVFAGAGGLLVFLCFGWVGWFLYQRELQQEASAASASNDQG